MIIDEIVSNNVYRPTMQFMGRSIFRNYITDWLIVGLNFLNLNCKVCVKKMDGSLAQERAKRYSHFAISRRFHLSNHFLQLDSKIFTVRIASQIISRIINIVYNLVSTICTCQAPLQVQ